MNIIAHRYLCLGRTEYFNFGSILPDLAKMGDGRVVRIKQPLQRSQLPEALQEVNKGVDFHLFIDQAYDNLPQVSRLRQIYTNNIFPRYFSHNRLLRRFLPIVLGDLLLDGYLLERSPEVAGLVVKTVANVESIASAGISTNPAGLEEVKSRFIPNLPNYALIDDVSLATQGVLRRRFGFELTKDGRSALFDSVLRYRPYVEHAGSSILTSMGMIAGKYHNNEQTKTIYKKAL